jgi:hypothetical protein
MPGALYAGGLMRPARTGRDEDKRRRLGRSGCPMPMVVLVPPVEPDENLRLEVTRDRRGGAHGIVVNRPSYCIGYRHGTSVAEEADGERAETRRPCRRLGS